MLGYTICMTASGKRPKYADPPKVHKSLMCLRIERRHIVESVTLLRSSVTLLQLRVEVLGPNA